MPISDLDEEIVSHKIFADEKRWRDLFARVVCERAKEMVDMLMLGRVPHLALGAPATFVGSNMVSGVRHLKLRFGETATA